VAFSVSTGLATNHLQEDRSGSMCYMTDAFSDAKNHVAQKAFVFKCSDMVEQGFSYTCVWGVRLLGC